MSFASDGSPNNSYGGGGGLTDLHGVGVVPTAFDWGEGHLPCSMCSNSEFRSLLVPLRPCRLFTERQDLLTNCKYTLSTRKGYS